jgi:hypothetical protein
MLRDDRALQACLVSDPAHVVPGAHGPHVAKIQSAILLLERGLTIPAEELRARRYGPKTAAAVLEFKRKRKIINFAYQTTADNIVGKMTIARLDQELLALEQRASSGRAVCRGGSGSNGGVDTESAPPFRLVSAPGRQVPTGPTKPPVMTFRQARISVVFQETDAAVEAGGGVHLLFGLVQKARAMMEPFGLDFAGAAGGIFPLIGPRIPDAEQVIPGSPASTCSVRAAAERVLPGRPGTLRVIFCPFTIKDDRTFGVTEDEQQVADWSFPKFCLINVRKANPDQGTLLHEIIHAARPGKRQHDLDPSSVFSENIGGRTKLPADHAEAIAHAFFSSILS